MIARLDQSGRADATAVVLSGAIVNLKVTRTAPVGVVRPFDDIDEARNWLRATQVEPVSDAEWPGTPVGRTKDHMATGQTLLVTAQRAGITKDYIWRLEKERQTVSILRLAGIAIACRTTVYALVAAAKREEIVIEQRDTGQSS